jgi:hypothetical protein
MDMTKEEFIASLTEALRRALDNGLSTELRGAALIGILLHELFLTPEGVAVGAVDGFALDRYEASAVAANALDEPHAVDQFRECYNASGAPAGVEQYRDTYAALVGELGSSGFYFSPARSLTVRELVDKRTADSWLRRRP